MEELEVVVTTLILVRCRICQDARWAEGGGVRVGYGGGLRWQLDNIFITIALLYNTGNSVST